MTIADLFDIAETIDYWFSIDDRRATILAVATQLHCPPSRQGMRRAMIEYLIDRELGTIK